jgi:hypothetical protein
MSVLQDPVRRDQIPTTVPILILGYSGGVTQRCHDVHHHNLGMELASQCGRRMNYTKRSIWKIDGQENLLDVQHRAPAGESKSF